MLSNQQEIFNSIALISVFFILLVAIIIITAVLYHNKKRSHKMAVANYENALVRSRYEVQEQTLQTIGADLHDNIGQLLSLTSLTLNSVELEEQPKAKKKVDAAIDLTLRSIKELRQLGKLLQGDQLIAIGLAEAIRHEIEWVERSGKFQVSYVDEGVAGCTNTDKDLIVFRILQESLNNIIKHSAASHINIKLEYAEAQLNLHINDNGIGFEMADLSAEKQGMGLHNIHKRVTIIGGEVIIRSKPGEGTGITIIIPYP